MQVEVDLCDDRGPRLVDSSDFQGFKVVVRGGSDRDRARESLAPVAAWLGDDHVAIPPGEVRRLAGEAAADPEWERSFDGMLRYAASKGWIVEGAIKAHIEWELE